MKFAMIPPKIDPKALKPYIPTEEDLRVCPLCRRNWVKVEEVEKTGHAYLSCLYCLISIWVRDPYLGLWTRIEKEECPICRHADTRLFFRSDGYLKFYCPKCKLIMENVDEKKHDALIKKEAKEGTRWLSKLDKERIDRMEDLP